ncbi:MAG: ferritin family protein [bacterium]
MTERTDRALKMLTTALEMEEKGQHFYQNALQNCQNPAGVEIFRMLAQDEVFHTRTIQKIYDRISGGSDWAAELEEMVEERRKDDLVQFFRDVAAKHGKDIHASTDDLSALEIGLDFERKAVDFYTQQLTEATEPLETRFLEEMIAEERSHVQLLADMQAYLSDPGSWFEQNERSLLDGA